MVSDKIFNNSAFLQQLLRVFNIKFFKDSYVPIATLCNDHRIYLGDVCRES